MERLAELEMEADRIRRIKAEEDKARKRAESDMEKKRILDQQMQEQEQVRALFGYAQQALLLEGCEVIDFLF